MPLIQGFDLYLLVIIALIQVTRTLRNDRLRTGIVSLLALVAYHFSRRKQRRIQDNLQNAFQRSRAPAELNCITRAVFRAFWQEIFDWAHDDSNALAARAQIVGTEHLQAALAQGRGAILWESSSYGKRVVSKHLLHANGFDVTQIHARLHAGGLGAGQRGMSRLMERVILPYFDKRAHRIVRDIVYLDEDAGLGFTRTLARQLAQNAILCVAIEGRVGHKQITLPFLGKPYPFATGMVSLAKLGDAPLLPLYCTPGRNGTYRLDIGPPVSVPHDADRENYLRAVLAHQVCELDTRIRRHPEWYWSWNLLEGK